MIDLPLSLAIPLAIAAAAAIALVGYALGLNRFLGRLQAAVDRAEGEPPEPAGRRAPTDPPPLSATRTPTDPPPLSGTRTLTRVHTVVLDGIAESGKSTLIHRLAFPCTDRASLTRLRATREAMRTRTLPVCFEPAPGGGELLHSLRFSDVSGERPGQIADTIDALHGEYSGAAGEARGRVISLWVWDMANTPRCRNELTVSRMKAAYGTAKARELVKGVVVFFNKVDLLAVDGDHLERLLADEERYLRMVVASCFDPGMPVVFHRGSALEGTGVTDCQGALYDAIGLGHHFRLADSGDGSPPVKP